MDLKEKLYKSREEKMIFGVCGGLGEYFNVDPTLIRLGFAGVTLFCGVGIIAYLLAAIIIPQKPGSIEVERSKEVPEPA